MGRWEAAGWAAPYSPQAPSLPVWAPRLLIKALEELHPLRAVAINLEKISGWRCSVCSSLSLHFPLQDSAAPHQRLPASTGPAGDLPHSVVTRVRA